jgi:hypothetical protein
MWFMSIDCNLFRVLGNMRKRGHPPDCETLICHTVKVKMGTDHFTLLVSTAISLVCRSLPLQLIIDFLPLIAEM